MNLRSGRIIDPPEESASNDPRSNPSIGTGPSSESSLSSDTMSAYEEGEAPRPETPTNSTSLLDRLSNLMGFGNTNTNDNLQQEEEVNSYFVEESLNREAHVEIAVPPPEENALAANGMTASEIQQIKHAIQLARQLEAEATLRGQQRLIEK